jgi:hypothetical protein
MIKWAMDKHECKIYVLFDSEGKVNYVGRTSRPIEKRMAEHRSVLGFEPAYRVIDQCSENCRDVERKWIEYYRERDYDLRNINYGQGPHFLPRESREKIALAFVGRPITWGEKIGDAQRGRPKQWSEEGRKKVAETQFKKGESSWSKLSSEEREKRRVASREAWKDPARAARMISGLKKRWGQKTAVDDDTLPLLPKKIKKRKPKAAPEGSIRAWWNSLTEEERALYVAEREKKPEPLSSGEIERRRKQKSERMSASQRARWAAYSPERRAEISKAFREGSKKVPLAVKQANGRLGAKIGWETWTPEQRADINARISATIRANPAAQIESGRKGGTKTTSNPENLRKMTEARRRKANPELQPSLAFEGGAQ